uniref:Uncharacterized protein n=1 Tax=Cucumis melo TaxID=3656 RepID=A0A9I9EBZ1_CUCME
MDDFERKGIGPRRPTRLGDFSGLKVEVDPLSSALVMVVKCVEAYLAMVMITLHPKKTIDLRKGRFKRYILQLKKETTLVDLKLQQHA